jgi:hypothetical protein
LAPWIGIGRGNNFRDTVRNCQLIEAILLLDSKDGPLFGRLRRLFQAIPAAEMLAAGTVSQILNTAMDLADLVLSLHL